MLIDLNFTASLIGRKKKKKKQQERPKICFPVPALSTKEPRDLGKLFSLSLALFIYTLKEEEIIRVPQVSLEAFVLLSLTVWPSFQSEDMTNSSWFDWDCPSLKTGCPMSQSSHILRQIKMSQL